MKHGNCVVSRVGFFAVLATVLAISGILRANNVQVTNVNLVPAGEGQADIEFDLSWENSWREMWLAEGGTETVTNWDAVWVFVKYRQTGGQWKHVKLQITDAVATGGTVIDVPAEGDGRGLGAFVYRSSLGAGSQNCPGMSLRWDFAAEGLPSDDEIDLAVMAVEMVYIPEGAFVLGSGGTEAGHFHDGSDETAPFEVTGEGEITIGTSAGQLHATGNLESGSIPAAFPKGYAAIYCMKYEITEGQYVAFLNLVDPTLASTLYFPNKMGLYGHSIDEADEGGYETAAPDKAVGYLGGRMFLDYLDWAGLRPMTELEFEKICRGRAAPYINEMPWGNTVATPISSLEGTPGSGQETALPAEANLHYSHHPVDSPVRAGIFADSSTTRETAGAGYYGVMNLGGNIQEAVVSASDNSADYGRKFTGAHGDGNEYTAHALQWPDYYERYSYAFRGSGYRLNSTDRARTSDRGSMGAEPFRSATGQTSGGRGVRTAP